MNKRVARVTDERTSDKQQEVRKKDKKEREESVNHCQSIFIAIPFFPCHSYMVKDKEKSEPKRTSPQRNRNGVRWRQRKRVHPAQAGRRERDAHAPFISRNQDDD
jgi:hypothetical protein